METKLNNLKFSPSSYQFRAFAPCLVSCLVGFLFIGVPKMEATKQCSKCKKIKPLSEFRKQKDCKDGYRPNCKSCESISEKKYRQTDKGRAYHKARKRRFNALNPNQVKAVNAINNAITAGKLPRPNTKLCYYCPKPAQQYHHWHGYEKEHWLDVVPVCRKCHHKCDRKIA